VVGAGRIDQTPQLAEALFVPVTALIIISRQGSLARFTIRFAVKTLPPMPFGRGARRQTDVVHMNPFKATIASPEDLHDGKDLDSQWKWQGCGCRLIFSRVASKCLFNNHVLRES
jgi:hypothetical protein